MTNLAGYEIIEKTGLSRGNIFYKAEKQENNKQVILKTLANQFPTSEEILRIKHEYEIGKELSIKGIPKYLGIEKKDGLYYLIMEDLDGCSLNQYLKNKSISLEQLLQIGIQTALILDQVHQLNVIHKNLNPDTVWINSNTGLVYLMDLSLASFTYKEKSKLLHAKMVEGNLFYISPEQTGRMNRALDHRCDFYSLGVILYEMATGEKPFDSRDSMELIHYQIAKSPVPPHLVKQNIPAMVSKIILKLLSKNAEDRYHAAGGLIADLQECLRHQQEGLKIPVFALGKADFSTKLNVSQKIYGREVELKILLDAFERTTSGAAPFLLLEGVSGVGKSALVHEMHKPITSKNGLFIEGKCNQFHRNIPYFPVINAFKDLVNLLVNDNVEKVELWKSIILKSIGNLGKVLTELIPNFEILIGKSPEIPVLPPIETQNRFNYVIRNLIKALSRKENPLVLFIDDLQWADNATIELLKNIMGDTHNTYFLILAAFRTTGVKNTHSTAIVFDDIQKISTKVPKIYLENLSYNLVRELITDTLNVSGEKAKALIDFVYLKTQGNPNFVNEFLKSLYDQGALFFDIGLKEWVWNIDQINLLHIPENILDLIADKIQKLQPDTQIILKLASCLGTSFTPQTLSVISEKSIEDVSNLLQIPIREGMIIRRTELYKFSHDKFHQAVYSLIPEKEKKQLHLFVGRSLYQNLRKEELEESVFEIVNQYSFAINEISSTEKYRLSELYYAAGVKSKNAAAYVSSFEYFQNGILMLPESSWQTNYQSTLSFYSEAAETAYLCGDFVMMEKWIAYVLKNAKSTIDKVKVYEIKIKACTADSKLVEGVNTALLVLNLLGIKFPENPNKAHIFIALFKIKQSLKGKKLESLLDMPVMQNETIEAAIRILSSVGSAVYFAKPNLFPLFVCKAFGLIVRHGNTPYSGFVCASYGIVILGGLKDFKTGSRLANLADKLMNKFPLERLKCRTDVVIHTFLYHWTGHIGNTFEPLSKAFNKGMETGDMEYAYYAALVYCYNKFASGHPLKELIAEMNVFSAGMSQIKQKTPQLSNSIFTQTAFNLINETNDPTLLNGTAYDEKKTILSEIEIDSKTSYFDFYFCKLVLCFIFGSHRRAIEYAQMAETFIKFKIGDALLPVFYFYESLSILAVKDFKSNEKKDLMERVKKNQEKLQEYSKYAPMNHLHRLYLVEAERYRVAGNLKKAAPLYDLAIHHAKENDFISDEAICYELTAKYYVECNHAHLAEFYFQKAYKVYYRWGALAKIKHFEIHYHHFISSVQVTSTKLSAMRGAKGFLLKKHNSYPEVPMLGAAVLDLESIMKASIAISSQTELNKLLEKLVKISIENAGAQKGFLILNKDETLFIQAEADVDSEQVTLHSSIPVKDNKLIPETIIHYVASTLENLVVNDAVNDPKYVFDSVISQNRIKSILCIPIVNHGNLLGILYFENNLAIAAFAEERIELLKLLSGQMAVSIENAINEEKKVADFLERETLLKKLNAHQKLVSKAIIQTQENERKRIAEDLHDGLGYMLSTLKLNLSSLQENHPAEDHERFVRNSLQLLEESFKELKTISNDLMPDILFNYGLITALEDICSRIKNTGRLNIIFKYFNVEKKFKKDFEIEVFRIVQEIINNVIKHAEAKNLEIQVIGQEDVLIITADDDGKGFNYDEKIKSKKKGKGLVNIVNRVNFLDGKCTYESSIGNGTTIIMELPVKTKAIKE